MLLNRLTTFFLWFLLFLMAGEPLIAQPVTGIWQGRMTWLSAGLPKSYQVELKLVRNIDSLRGIAYYYNTRNNYFTVPVRGYVNPYDGTVTWWQLTALARNEKGGPIRAPIPEEMQFSADYNCPGEGIMKLDGRAEMPTAGGKQKSFPVHLRKTGDPVFEDDWNEVLEHPSWVVEDPQILDRLEEDLATQPTEHPIALHDKPDRPKPGRQARRPAAAPMIIPEEKPGQNAADKPTSAIKPQEPEKVRPQPQKPAPLPTPVVSPPSIESLFRQREKIMVTEIPVSGDTLELHFYDHAEIDGDSIAIFLGDVLMEKNILLKASPYILKLAVDRLSETNDLTMVAENLGTIPPNTSLMITYINGQRYETRLESTEQSSAMIRFFKPRSQPAK